ncbi:chaplin [Streptomyces caniferus]|uniref:chaplin n=1 Tax=Streptomyces caniferus TaxID=285557 RepID=UPI002E2927FF|nr:chaplin family protein [Streptomyces caniferus]
MRQSLKTCVFVAAAASGVLGAGGGVAYADAGAAGGATNSPGVLSGNNIQVTVDTPVNVCGNSVDGGAALNPAMGASCGNGAAPVAAAQRPLAAASPPPAAHRRAPGSAPKHAAPESAPRVRPQAEPPAGTAPKHARTSMADPAAGPAARSVREGAGARTGSSAGSALLASTGPGELGMVAGVGGGLLVGGALLLRRAGTRRR